MLADFVVSGGVPSLANVKDIMIVRSNITGLAHIPNYPWTLDLAKLARKSK